MPAVTATTAEEQNEADQKMWSALKRYIIRERQRKKEGLFTISVLAIQTLVKGSKRCSIVDSHFSLQNFTNLITISRLY